jgi:hypothetical protein
VRHVRLALAITLAPAMAALLLTTRAAPAVAEPAPVDIPLTGPANGGSCPPASYVVVSPGGPSQVLLVVPPGAPGCPPGGLDMTINPGAVGSPPGEAVALPLTAGSCQAGTQLLDSQVTALGQTPGGGIGSGPPGGGGSACPGGDAAYAQLQATIARVSRLAEEEGIFYFFKHRDGGHVLVVGGHTGVTRLAGVYDVATGTPVGAFVLRPPGSLPTFYGLQPSGTAGVATVVCGLCLG